jgi:hypothetical protein
VQSEPIPQKFTYRFKGPQSGKYHVGVSVYMCVLEDYTKLDILCKYFGLVLTCKIILRAECCINGSM